MGKTPRTYDAPPAGAGATGLEDYVVDASDGSRIGTVVAVVERNGGSWLVVEAGTPPVKRDRRIVPWEEVRNVDHDSLAVRLGLDARRFERCEQVDKSEEEERGAEGDRLASQPLEMPASVPTGDVAGPHDRAFWLIPLASTLLGVLFLLGLAIAFSLREVSDAPAYALLIVPAILFGIGAVTAYRLWRNPYEQRS